MMIERVASTDMGTDLSSPDLFSYKVQVHLVIVIIKEG